ncbi:hypothetical protein GAMM_40057 [Gammaproteobacteria bacterium]
MLRFNCLTSPKNKSLDTKQYLLYKRLMSHNLLQNAGLIQSVHYMRLRILLLQLVG